MIRINLLSEGKKPVAAKKTSLRPSFSGFGTGGLNLGGLDLGSALLIGLAALALIIALSQNFLLGRKISAKQKEVAAAQVEVDRLAPIIAEVEEFKAKKAALEQKVQVIRELKANQAGPVKIMDNVSAALPELLWLRRMEVIGNRVSLDGQAFNTDAVAHFIENLDKVPEFQEPVLQDTAQTNQAYDFRVTFTFTHTPDETNDEIAASRG